MKPRYKYIIPLVMTLAAAALLLRCSSDEPGAPYITYIRVTNPTKSDSLLASAGQGQMVAIIGGNLSSVQQVWFNDQLAPLVTTFITNTSVLTKIPTQIPNTVNNKLKMIFANGDSLLYDFEVAINKPSIDHARSEYENVGDSLFIYGKYFYKPLTVTFTGGAQAQILSITDDATGLVVKVPADAQPGPITIASNFGETASDFWFDDNRGIIASFDAPLSNNAWRGMDFVVASDQSIPTINGNFLRINKGALGAYPYLEIYGGPTPGDISAVTKNLPADALVDPASYSLKFEIATLDPITGAYMRLYLGNADSGSFGDARNNIYYVWQPNVDTHGNWATITLPWKDVYTANQLFAYNSAGYGMYIYFHGPNPAKYNLAMDNFRVVPNIDK